MRFACEKCSKIITIDDGECGNKISCGHCGEETEVPIDRCEPGAVIHDFLLLKNLGMGKTGQVFLARQLSLDREVALRVLRGNLEPDSELVVELFREARMSSKLFHTNIAQSLAVGMEDGLYFQAMEYVDGRTLQDIIENDGAMPWETALGIFGQAAEGLDFAWQHQHMVYRAFSPLSLMVTTEGVAKLVDFSAAYTAATVDEREVESLLITPYTSPEDVDGAELDVRSDIYCLGATMYFAVTGIPPYDGRTPDELTAQIREARPRAAVEIDAAIPERVSLIIQKMMARVPDHRYQTPSAVADELRRTAISLSG